MKRSINWKKLLLYVPIAGLLVFIYFSFLMLITPDSVGYYSYLNILNGTASFSVWNTTRGPGMPFILFLITKLFGATELGLLIGSFIFFVLALFIAFKLVQIIQKDFKERKVNNYIVWILFVVLIIFNPLIIGYYHVLLTEFVAATAAIVSCYLSFKWISIEFIKSKLQFIIYTIVFCLLSVLMWFVKQPYVTVVVLPLFIATVLSMIKIGNIKNIASKVATFALVVVCIVGGIGVWNEILKKNNVTFSKSLNSYALHGVIAALTDFPKVPYEESHSASYLSNTEYLTSEEVNETESILNGNSKYQDYNIYEVKSIRHNVVIDRIVVPLVYKDDLTSTDVLTFFKECVKKHPLQVLDSYLVNYFTESDIYPFQMDNEGYIVPVKILIPVYQFWNENLSIGLGTYYKGSTFLEGTPKIDTMEQYEMPMSPDSSLNYGMKVFSKLIIITYKITFVLVPVFSAFFFIKYCIAIVKKKDSKYLRLYELLVILFGFAFLHLLSNVFTGLIIDRYAFVAYLPALLGMILLINFLDFGEVKVRFIEIVNKLKKKEMNIEEYAKHKYFFTLEIPQLLLKHMKKTKWNTFLDVGCGDGNLLYTLNEKGYFNGKKVYAVDLSKERIRRVNSLGKNFSCFVNNACDLKDIKDNSIDVLTSTMVIEHVADDKQMVKEIHRVLNPKTNIAYVNTVFKKWYGWYWYRNHGKWVLDPTHLREYTDDSLLKVFENEGLEILETKKTLLWFSPVNMIVRITHYAKDTKDNKFLKFIDRIKVPIFGYYNWEIVCRRVK